MKILRLLSLLILLAFISSTAVSGHPSRHQHKHHKNSTGAPLDGGILAVLGAAGVAYFVARKKRMNDTTL
jgi:hypothetical protein